MKLCDIKTKPNNVGKAIGNVLMIILDDYLHVTPPGKVGQIYIGGKGLTRGYIDNEAANQKKFIRYTDTNDVTHRLYATGDLGTYNHEYDISYLGRMDKQVKVYGYRIDLSEIDETIRECPGVKDSVVIQTSKTEARQLWAFYTTNSREDNCRLENIKTHLTKKLPFYMIPKKIIQIEALPLTSNGKVDRNALENSIKPNDDMLSLPSKDPLKAILNEAWCRVLGVAHIEDDNNFFELGGDSILAIQLTSFLKQQSVSVTVRQLYLSNSFSDLLKEISTSSTLAYSQPHSNNSIIYEPSPIQKWFFMKNLPAPDHWNQSILLELTTEHDPDDIKNALNALFDHHDVFKFRFKFIDGRSLIYSENDSNYVVYIDDESTLKKDSALSQLFNYQNKISISNGPAALAVIIQGIKQKIYIIAHHLVIDAVSWRIICNELDELLSLNTSKKIRLSLPKSNGYRTYLDHLKATNSNTLQQEALIWNDYLKNAKNTLKPDKIFANLNTASQNEISGSLNQSSTKILLNESQSTLNATIYHVLLYSLCISLIKHTGENSVYINLEGHGRSNSTLDVSNTVGWFTGLYPLHVVLSDKMTIIDGVSAIKDTLLSLPDSGENYLRLTQDHELGLIHHEAPMICFNYLGKITSQSTYKNFTLSNLPLSIDISSLNPPMHQLEINAAIIDGVLEVRWKYCNTRHSDSTIQALKKHFFESLNIIVESSSNLSIMPLQEPLPQNYTNLKPIEIRKLIDTYPNLQALLPCTPMQKQLLYTNVTLPADASLNNIYFIQSIYNITQELNIAIFISAWKYLTNIHPALRSRFDVNTTGHFISLIMPDINIPYDFYDISNINEEKKLSDFNEILIRDKEMHFDLSNDVLFRLKIVKLDQLNYKIIFTHHHIILDGWSGSIIWQQIKHIYDDMLNNRPLMISESNYFSYINWLNDSCKITDNLFWNSYFKGYKSQKSLHQSFYSAASMIKSQYKTQVFKLSPELTHSLETLHRKAKTTLSVIMQSAWSILISILLRSNDVVFGLTLSGRSIELKETEHMVGLFINTLPFRLNLTQCKTLYDVIRATHFTNAEITQNLQYTLPEIFSLAENQITPSIIDSLFVFENYPAIHLGKEDAGLNMTADAVFENSSYPLTLVIHQTDHINIRCNFDMAYYEPNSIDLLLRCYLRVLNVFILDLQTKISSVCLLNDLEVQQYLIEPEPYIYHSKTQLSVNKVFEKIAHAMPAKTAIIDGKSQITYSQLNQRSNMLARYLMQTSKPGDLVSILLDNQLECIITMLAVLKMGGYYLVLDCDMPSKYIIKILADASNPLTIANKYTNELLETYSGKTLDINKNESIIHRESTCDLLTNQSTNEKAYLIFTSGTTKKPKGVVIKHASILRLVCEPNYIDILPSDVIAQTSNMSFDASTFEVWGALLNGASLAIYKKPDLLDALQFKEVSSFYHVNIMWLTSSLFNTLISLDSTVFKNLKYLLIGGDKLSIKHINILMENPDHAPKYILNGYGPTESTTFASVYELENQIYNQAIPIGRAVNATQLFILDANMQPLPKGIIGEICIAGDGLAEGYFNQPKLTAEKFTSAPKAPKIRLYRSGDLGAQKSEVTYFCGREDRQIKRRGYLINLEMIENTINSLDYVFEAKVIAKIDQDDPNLFVFVVIPELNSQIQDKFRADLKSHLPHYLMPDTIQFLNSIPLNKNGKMDVEMCPDKAAPLSNNSIVGSSDDMIQKIKLIVEDVLSKCNININSDLFSCGLHSLKIIYMLHAFQKQLGQKITVNEILSHRTIRDLAELITSRMNLIIDADNSSVIKFKEDNFTSTVIFLPPGDGLCLCYKSIIEELLECNIHGYNHPQYSNDSVKFSSLENLASYYVQCILNNKLTDNILLAGWSFGGVLAYEVAFQLARKGYIVNNLVLIDSFNFSRAKSKHAAVLNDNMENLNNEIPNNISYSKSLIKNILSHNIDLLFGYEPEKLPLNVTLLKASESCDFLKEFSDDLGWSNVCSSQSHIINGTHAEMMSKAASSKIATIINGIILSHLNS